MIHIGGRTYELIRDHKDGWNPDAFRERFSEVLERYDYVIGDWGYNQLRLKGFFRDNHPKVTRDSAFSGMLDYINEYCNFGCAYFVLQKQPGVKKQGEDEEDADYDDSDGMDYAEGYESGAELPVRTAVTAEIEDDGQEQPRTTPRIVREHQKREYHPRHQRKESAVKDLDKDRDSRDSRKSFNNKDRDRDMTRNQSASSQQDRGHSGGGADRERDRGRHRKPHFTAPKAPVAAALESTSPGQPNQPRQQNHRGKDSGNKS